VKEANAKAVTLFGRAGARIDRQQLLDDRRTFRSGQSAERI
jgi:hypothetical protein